MTSKQRGSLKSLALASVEENGRVFSTGTPVTFPYIRNTAKSTKSGGTFQQGIEPHGRYLLYDTVEQPVLPSGWERGVVRFRNPLVLYLNPNEAAEGRVFGPSSWKARLTAYYGAKGRALSRKLMSDGYDGIVTISNANETSEIVDLTAFRPTRR